jgi:Nif-specific regulatory protein
MDLLLRHHWPGNVRELANVMERAVILCGLDGVIEAAHLPAWLQQAPGNGKTVKTLDEALADLEKKMLTEAMETEQGNMSRAAARLGITTRIMGLRVKSHGLEYKSFRHK